MNLIRQCFFLNLVTVDCKTILPNRIGYAIALKIAKILAAQASAQSFENNCGASAIAGEIVALQEPISG